MGHLLGLQEYLEEKYNISIFDQAFDSKESWEIHLHNHRIVRAVIIENLRYDLKLSIEGAGEELIQKTEVKLLYQVEKAGSIRSLIKTDKKVKVLGLEPVISPKQRHHIKNKSLFPLMKERRVLIFKLLEGEIIKGIISGFSRYDITISLKGEIPITILRHSVYDLRDKKGRCFLKSFQEEHRDWEKDDLYVSDSTQ